VHGGTGPVEPTCQGRRCSARAQEAKMPLMEMLGMSKRKANGATEDMDILDKLGKEHNEVQALLKKLLGAKTAAERNTLFCQIKTALVPHVRAEEKVVYDRVLALSQKDAKEDGNEAYIEHSLADEMLEKLSSTRNKMAPEWTAAAKVLAELVNHHIAEEESALWAHVKKNFSAEEREEMNRAFEVAKKPVRLP
jgi:hemerythrin superfamily protein